MYNRINWKNYPSLNTPINADNLNVMDEGIYNNNNSINDLIPVVLYENESGTTSTITLSDTVNNYSYLECFYSAVLTYFTSCRIFNPSVHKVFSLTVFDHSANISDNIKRCFTTYAKVEGNTLTHVISQYNWIVNDSVNYMGDTTPKLKIYKILGYK